MDLCILDKQLEAWTAWKKRLCEAVRNLVLAAKCTGSDYIKALVCAPANRYNQNDSVKYKGKQRQETVPKAKEKQSNSRQ